jgi:uncharacterized repeat protein (TIGR03803 family)
MILVQGTDGNFYGTTSIGGAKDYGTIFRVTPAGTITTLHSFCLQTDCFDGADPYEGVVLATDGNLYGLTTYGGSNGWGTVYKITQSGVFTLLHSFEDMEGFYPAGALVQARDGNFYGIVTTGESGDQGGVFRVTPEGTLTVLHSFLGADGSEPEAGLVLGTDGNLYGITFAGGGSSACAGGCGTVFRITLDGTLTTLHSFELSDGAYPDGKLVRGSDGNFYGTTNGGGTDGWGVVFKITPQGAVTTLHSFDLTQGGAPWAGLVQAANGNFYGTTRYGGSANVGTLFEITPQGAFRMLQSFGGSKGTDPSGGLLQATNGVFYGAAWGGGTVGDGTIFSESAGFAPFVAAVPTSGKIESTVMILGMNLEGATRVTFNGAPATFTVKSSTLITAVVPAEATTGVIEVGTPSGTTPSNVPFRVIP